MTKIAIPLILLVWIMLAFPLQAGGLSEDLEKLREAYAATNNANFVAVLDSAQSSGSVIRYQWKDPADGFVYRRQDVAKVGRSDFQNPAAIEQSSRWNQEGFFIIVGKRAIRHSMPGLDWLPKYDFNWITRITTRNRDFNSVSCTELRVEVNLPTGSKVAVIYWIDQSHPFIRGYEVVNEQNESMERFDFGSTDFKSQLETDMFKLPIGISSEERKFDRTLTRQLYRGNDTPAIRQLQQAINHTLTLSYTASLKVLYNNPEYQATLNYMVYQQPIAGRRLPLVRIDQIEIIQQKPILTSSRLVNKQGAFVFYGSHAVKSKFPWLNIPPYLVLDAEPGLTAKENKLPNGDTVYTLRFSSVPEGINRNEFAILRKFYIRPNTEFIYAWEGFTQDGRMIYRYEFEDIDFEPEFPSGIFNLPRWVKMHEVDELDQIRERFYREITISSTPGWFQRQYKSIRQFCGRNTGSILAWGGEIFFWLAIVTAAVVIVLKIRTRRLNSR